MEREGFERALVLHVRPHRETSLLVEVLTERHGRVRCLARGARRGRHPQSHILRPLNPVRLGWLGRGELPLLTQVEAAEPALPLQGRALYCGFYIGELLHRLLPLGDPQPMVLALSLEVLVRLAAGDDEAGCLRHFELALLEALGYGLQLETDAEGLPIQAGRRYRYHPEQGALAAPANQPDAVAGGTLLALWQRAPLSAGQQGEAKRLMRAVIQHHLDGRPLKSRELFQSDPTRYRRAD